MKNVLDNAYYSTDKMKKYIVGLVILGLLSCSEKEKTKVSQEKMIDVLTDLTIASSARTVSNKRDSIQYYTSYEHILELHGLDSLQFVKAQQAYQSDPDLYAVIYDSVNNRIQKKLDEVRAEPTEEEETAITPVSKIRDLPFSRRKE